MSSFFILAAHQQDKTDLDDLLLEQPKFETLLRTQHSDLPQVQEQVPSLQCSQEDSFSTLKYEAKEVDASESCINHNAGKPILAFCRSSMVHNI